MIKLLTDEKIKDFLDFCQTDLFGVVLYTRLLTYGANDSEVMFWYSEKDGKINAVCGILDGVFSFCKDSSADCDELRSFAEILGAREIYDAKNCFLLKFNQVREHQTAQDIDGENLKDIFPVIFEGNKIGNDFFEKWYTDISHKIRHGFIHGKCIYEDGKCVSAALTSGETNQTAILSSVATMKSYRHKGFGERVVNSLAASLPQEVYLLTDNRSTAAWYERIGWRIVDCL